MSPCPDPITLGVRFHHTQLGKQSALANRGCPEPGLCSAWGRGGVERWMPGSSVLPSQPRTTSSSEPPLWCSVVFCSFCVLSTCSPLREPRKGSWVLWRSPLPPIPPLAAAMLSQAQPTPVPLQGRTAAETVLRVLVGRRQALRE